MVSTRQMATSNVGCSVNNSSSTSNNNNNCNNTNGNAAAIVAATNVACESTTSTATTVARLSVVTRQTTSNSCVLINCPSSTSVSLSSSSLAAATAQRSLSQATTGGNSGSNNCGGLLNIAGGNVPCSTAFGVGTVALMSSSSVTTPVTLAAASALRHRDTHLTQAVKASSSGNTTNAVATTSIVVANNCTTLAVVAPHTNNNNNGSSNSTTNGGTTTSRIQIFDLPLEVLTEILSYVEYKKVGQLRMVSRKMNDVCMHILNSTFSKLITQTFNRFHAIKANMPRRESARRNHPLACECDIIETCYMRLSLLQMTFGKHIERGHCCFFPGAILDEVYNILNHIRNTPCLERPYRVTDELFDLSTMAMEYFRDRIESTLPDIYLNKDFFKLPPTTKRPPLVITSDLSDSSSNLPSPPQSNMVLRKGIRKIKQGMKMYNNQLSVLRNELRTCKRKSSEQAKQIGEQQKLLAEQQKQMLEYANRLDENDKKNEEISRKFSTCLQELNKCKTELQYWRSKSPAIPTCTSCGQKVAPVLPPEDYQALINQGIKPEDIILNLNDDVELENDASVCDGGSLNCEFVFPDEETTAKLLAVNTATRNLKRQHSTTVATTTSNINTSSGSGNIADMSLNSNHDSEGCHGSRHNSSNSYCGVGGMMHFVNYARGSNIIRSTAQTAQSTSTASSTAANDGFASVSAVHNQSKDLNNGIGDVATTSSGYSTKLFYGINAHKGVIVSPSMLHQANKMVATEAFDASHTMGDNNVIAATTATCTASSNDTCGSVASTAVDVVEDVASLQLVTSHETKKARRVQKATRCLNGSGKRSK